jgi:hypothetical protein
MPKNSKNNRKQRSQKKSKTPKKKSKKTRANRQRVGVGRGLSMSPCAAHYATAVGAPFSSGAIGACVPTFPARPSFKVHARTLGSLFVGPSAFGFLAIAPSIANNVASAWSSLPSYNQTKIDITDLDVTTYVMAANPYASGAFLNSATADAMAGRIVSVGIRIRYVGTELDRGGLIYGFVSPTHDNINTLGLDKITAYRECIRRPVNREWTTIVVTAIDMDECEYPDSSQYWILGNTSLATINMLYPFSSLTQATSTLTTTGAPVACFIVTGVEGNEFEFEIIQHSELIGRQVQPVVTASHADAQGLSMLIEAKGHADMVAGSNTSHVPYEKNFGRSIMDSLRSFNQKAVGAAKIISQISEGMNIASETYGAVEGLYGSLAALA